MSTGAFVHCPTCGRLMLGYRTGGTTYPQPHDCRPEEGDDA